MNCANHCYKNEIAMHESFALLLCTKEYFNSFKAANPSAATVPVKTSVRSALRFILPLESNDSVYPNHGESHYFFDLSYKISMASANFFEVLSCAV